MYAVSNVTSGATSTQTKSALCSAKTSPRSHHNVRTFFEIRYIKPLFLWAIQYISYTIDWNSRHRIYLPETWVSMTPTKLLSARISSALHSSYLRLRLDISLLQITDPAPPGRILSLFRVILPGYICWRYGS